MQWKQLLRTLQKKYKLPQTGIVSVRTKRPSGEAKAETVVTGSAPLSQLQGAGLGGEIQHYLSGGGDVVDYSVSLGAKHVGGSYDAKGKRIAPEPSQGDLFDSNTWNLGGKIGHDTADRSWNESFTAAGRSGDLDGLIVTLQGLAPQLAAAQEARKAQRAQQNEETRAAKEAMVEQAEKLAAGNDWRGGVNRFRALLDEWKALPRIVEMSPSEGLFAESLMAASASNTPEAQARLRAFLEGRAGKVVKE